jgi:hypothetical protein
MFDVCTTDDKVHIDTIFKFSPHTRQLLHDPFLKVRIIAAVKNIDALVLTRVWQEFECGVVRGTWLHATRHNTPIHNISSTAPQMSISQKALGMAI